MNNIFRKLVLSNAVVLLLIIVWGGYQTTTNTNQAPASAIDIGGIVFMLFSVAYFVNSYLLYQLNTLGKTTYLPLIISFIIIGFLGELISPMTVNKDLFYLIIFYIISPIFFVVQGLILGLIYFTSVGDTFKSQTV